MGISDRTVREGPNYSLRVRLSSNFLSSGFISSSALRFCSVPLAGKSRGQLDPSQISNPLALGSQVGTLSRWTLSTVSRWSLTRRQVVQYLLRLSVAASCRQQPPHTFSSAVFASVFQKIIRLLHFHFILVEHVTIYLV